MVSLEVLQKDRQNAIRNNDNELAQKIQKQIDIHFFGEPERKQQPARRKRRRTPDEWDLADR